MSDLENKPSAPAIRRKRRRWGLWLLVAACGLVAAGAVAHRLWGDANERRLLRQVDALARTGEPVQPSDLNYPAVPDDRNAAVPLRIAAGAIQIASPAWARYQAMNLHPPLTPAEGEIAAMIVNAHAQSLKLIREARDKPETDWNLRFSSPMMLTLLTYINGQRSNAQLLQAAMYDAHRRGDHHAVVEYARDTLYLGRAVGRQPLMITALVSMGIREMAVEALSDMAPTLRIEPAGGADGQAADPEQVRVLITELLDDKPLQMATLSAIRAERVGQLDAILSVVSGRIPFKALNVFGGPRSAAAMAAYGSRPMMLDDAAILLEHMTRVLGAASKAPTWPAYQKLAPTEIDKSALNPFRHLMISLLLPSMERFMERRYEQATSSRLAATALAARRYALEHGGERPATLEALVPHYLPVVPADAMTEAGVLRFIADPPDPRIYSVGENNVDDGGNDAVDKSGRRPKRPLDFVVHLTQRPRTGDDAPTPDNLLPPLSTTAPSSQPTTAP